MFQQSYPALNVILSIFKHVHAGESSRGVALPEGVGNNYIHIFVKCSKFSFVALVVQSLPLHGFLSLRRVLGWVYHIIAIFWLNNVIDLNQIDIK